VSAFAFSSGYQSSLTVKSGGSALRPEAGNAMVVFMRPSSFGGAI
jgi:hypothetical protein